MDERLEDGLVEDVLDRLGTGSVDHTVDGVAALYRAWCEQIPFDNLRKLVGLVEHTAPLPGDDPNEFYREWLEHGTGATCWASANATWALFDHLGFEAVRTPAAMMDLPDPNHGTVVVAVDGVDLLVDSSILSVQPIEVGGARSTNEVVGYRVSLEPDGDDWMASFPSGGGGKNPCRFWPMVWGADEFADIHEHTREWSIFNRAVHVRRQHQGVMSVLNDRYLARFGPDGATFEQLSETDRHDWLLATGYSRTAVDAALTASRTLTG